MTILEKAIIRAVEKIRLPDRPDNLSATQLGYAAREAIDRIRTLESALAELLACSEQPPDAQQGRTARAIEAARQALK